MQRVLLFFFLSTIAPLALAQSKDNKNHTAIVIKAGRLIDVVRSRVLQKQAILIEGDRIKAVGAEESIPIRGGTTVIEVGRYK